LSRSAFVTRGKEKGSSEIEEDRCEEISDPSNGAVCLSFCLKHVTVSIQYSSMIEIRWQKRHARYRQSISKKDQVW